MNIQNKITAFLQNQGVEFIHFVDISHLHESQNKGFSGAILFGKTLSKPYVKIVSSNPDYVSEMIQNKQINTDEFHRTEIETDNIADSLAGFIQSTGLKAFSQSEKNLENSGSYNLQKQSTPLPHKTIALMAGIGWIGKHNLLVTPNYGSAISMCTVLTDADIETLKRKLMESKCGDCTICFDICVPKALTNSSWKLGIERDDMLDASKCTTCIQCMMQCPWTQQYADKSDS